ncbi:Transducin/WD40 repeat-like superfamily protein [Forsythia ovata]|uniref:Transducin/WD40 repeat-like superfamily protein n=1 Tax=Forsythia ovata TaxID=205694 RepID=A0ABD1S2W7_9LAMI
MKRECGINSARFRQGKQLTMDEFEKSDGYSPIVKELMRHENVSRHLDDGPKINANSYFTKSFRNNKRRGVAFLKGDSKFYNWINCRQRKRAAFTSGTETSAGEDRIIRVWEVQECEVRPLDDLNSVCGTPYHPITGSFSNRPLLAEITPLPSEKRKKGKNPQKEMQLSEIVFALSENPVCILNGHQDDILDLYGQDLRSDFGH